MLPSFYPSLLLFFSSTIVAVLVAIENAMILMWALQPHWDFISIEAEQSNVNITKIKQFVSLLLQAFQSFIDCLLLSFKSI